MSRFGSLAEELRGVLSDIDTPRRQEEGRGGCRGCGDFMMEALRSYAEEIGLDPKVLTEGVKCDTDCSKKYMDDDGSFKGKSGTGDEFDNCVKRAENCCTGVKDARALCAHIGRKAGKIP